MSLSDLPPPPIQAPIGADMPLNPVWIRWMQNLFSRVGGSTGTVLTDGDVTNAMAMMTDPPGQSDDAAIIGAMQDLQLSMQELHSYPQSVPLSSHNWTPTFTGLTTVGSVSYTGRIVRLGPLCLFTAEITTSGGGTSASTSGVTYIDNFPYVPRNNAACSVSDITALAAIGAGVVNSSNGRIFSPTWGATSSTITLSGIVEVL